MIKKLLILAGAAAAFVVGCAGILFYTSLPFHFVALFLSAAHLDVEGVSGSIATGIKVGKLSVEGPGSAFDLEDFQLTYGGLRDYFEKDEINVSELSIGKLVLKGHSNDGHAGASQSSAPKTAGAAPGKGRKAVRFAKIDISNVQIDFSDTVAPLELDNWRIRNLSFVDGKLDFDTFEVDSNAGDLSLSHGPAAPGQPATPKSMDIDLKFTLKPTYLKRLKAPITFAGRFRIDDGEMDRKTFSMSAFDGKGTLRFDDAGLLALRIDDLDFSSYLNESYPIRRVTLSATLGPDCARLDTFRILQGQLGFGAGRLDIAPGPALVLPEGAKQWQLHITAAGESGGRRVSAELTRVLPEHLHIKEKISTSGSSLSEPLKIALSSEPKSDADELLARLIYGRAPSALKPEEKTSLEASKAYFSF